jgi:hypothetical protein
MTDHVSPPERVGLKIVPPQPERIGVAYYLLIVLSFLLVVVTLAILTLEWLGVRLPFEIPIVL